MSEKEEVSIKVSFTEEDAAFLSALQEHAEPTYLGDYIPQYLDVDQMSDLNWSDVSTLANYEEDLGFTLEGEQISALLLDLREYDQVVTSTIGDHISKLQGLKELVVLLPEDHEMFDISSNTHLQYLEIHKDREPVKLSAIDKLEDLVVLVVRAQLPDIPDLSTNVKLQRLVMRSTSVEEFPQMITKLEKLVWLEFGNKFKTFPDDALNLTDLVVLDLVSDQLESLPDEFANLSKLQHLSLETDKLAELPPSFDQFEHLTDLYLWNLPFDTLPKIICNLTTLKYLWFKENSKLRGQLTSIPEEIGQLINLIDLQLNGHELEELPDSIGKLTKLEILNLGINQLTSFNPHLLELESLQRLELYLNPIEELPEEIGNLKELQYLDISDTKITEIPSSISRLRNLESFDALGCDLHGLPKTIANLNYTKISMFLISLHDEPETLDPEVQDWLDKLVNYADENEEKGIEIEISLYEPEEDDKFDEEDEDNPALIEDDKEDNKDDKAD